MSKYGSSYQGNNFLEWWKHHYGTDYDGSSITKTGSMTDEDVAIGRSLLNSYNQQQQLTNQYNQNVETETNKYNSLIESSDKSYDSQIAGAQSEYDRNAQLLLENYNRNTANAKEIYDRNTAELLANYGTAQDALDKSKRQSQQNASITLDKLKKYLPSQIKAQGLGGLGVSESSMLQAYNNYNSEMGSIESGYQESKTNLDTNYNTNKNAYDTQYQQTQGDLDSLYGDSKARLDSTFESAKSGFETAKAQASDTYKAQLADTLAKLKSNYDQGIYASDKDADGNLLVDNVLQEYAQALAQEQGVNYETALAAIRNAIYTDSAEMNSFVEQYRGKVNDQQLAALFQEGTNVANTNAETARREQAAKTEKEQASNYENALTAIGQSAYSTMDEMNLFIEQFRGKVTESQLNSLFQTGKGVVDTNAAKKAEQLRQEEAARQEQIRQEEAAKAEADRQNAYIVAQATVEELIADGKFDEAKSYLESNKAILGDTYTAYMTTVNSKVQQKQQADQEAATKEHDQRVIEGKEFINYGGKEYKILEKIDKNANEITNNDSFTEKLKGLGFTNPYDKNIPNGTTIYINRDSTGSDKVQFWDFVPFVHGWFISGTGTNNWHITYYNGEWYHSEEQ